MEALCYILGMGGFRQASMARYELWKPIASTDTSDSSNIMRTDNLNVCYLQICLSHIGVW